MIEPKDLASDALFAVIPNASEKPGTSIQNIEDLDNAPLPELIDSTYYALKQDDVTLADALILWEIRLTLLLYNNQLAIAKREGVNLSNAFYLHENPNTSQPPNAPQPSRVGSGLSNAGPLTPESSRSQSPSMAAPKAHGPRSRTPHMVYPMPKNNGGYIHHALFVMLLRLRSAPNLSLVNELYTLCYQSRLREEPSGYSSLEAKLIRLAYQVIAILVITKNYSTLLDFIGSLETDLASKVDSDAPSDISQYLSNVSLMHIVAKAHWAKVRGSDPNALQPVLQPVYLRVNSQSLQALAFVMNTVSPVLGGEVSNSDLRESDLELDSLLKKIAGDAISPRSICCMLSVWDLAAAATTKLTPNEFSVEFDGDATQLGTLHTNIRNRWGSYVNKLYAME